MGIPLVQQYRIGRYILEQKLKRNKRYPLVLMLEPLFQCNLACAGCGKIDYSNDILRKRMSVEDALNAVDECGAPVVSIPGGEPLLRQDLPELIGETSGTGKFKIIGLTTNGVLLATKLDRLVEAGLNRLNISLDSLDRDTYYAITGRDCLNAVLKAVNLALNHDVFGLVKINLVVMS